MIIDYVDIADYLNDGNELLSNEQITALNPWFTLNYYEILKTIIRYTKCGRSLLVCNQPDDLQTAVQEIVNAFFLSNAYKFEKLYNSTLLSYETLVTRSGSEHKTETNSGTDVTNGTFTPNTSVVNSERAFDNNSLTEVNKSTNSGTDTSKSELQHGHVINHDNSFTEQGEAPQDIIEKEREVSKFNYISFIADELVNYLCVSTWEMEE